MVFLRLRSVKRAATAGMPAVALMIAVTFLPWLSFEACMAEGSKAPVPPGPRGPEGSAERLLLLARNLHGYRNLLTLISAAIPATALRAC